MSSSPSVANSAAISSPLRSPSGSAKVVFMSPATSSSAPLGRFLSASTNFSIVEVLSGGKVTSHDVPLQRPRHHLESDDVGAKLLDSLHRKVRRRPAEDCHSATVSARRIRRDDAIPRRPTGVYPVHHCFLLKDSKVHVGLGHPP